MSDEIVKFGTRHLSTSDEMTMAEDAILPSQYHLREEVSQPEAKLALAIIEDAVHTIRKTHGVDTPQAKALRAETLEWFASESEEPWSFRWLAAHLDIEPQVWSKHLARWT